MKTFQLPKIANNIFALNALLALLYILSGYLGVMLAIAPGYATAIFPSAGIALGFSLCFGARVLPGVFVGSLLLNLLLPISSPQSISVYQLIEMLGRKEEILSMLFSLYGTCPIAAGAALQTYLATKLIRYTLKNHLNLEHSFAVLGFSALGGPIACMTSATIGAGSLVAFGKIPPSEFLSNFSMWWLGDTLGVLIFAPITLAALSHHFSLRRKLVIILPSVFLFLCVVILYIWASHSTEEKFTIRKKKNAFLAAAQIKHQLQSHSNALNLIAAFAENTSDFNETAFQSIADRVTHEAPELEAIAWAPFQYTSDSVTNSLVHAKIQYLSGKQRNNEEIGYDFANETIRRDMLERLLETGKVTSSAGILRDQAFDHEPKMFDIGQSKSVILAAPVHQKNNFQKIRGAVIGKVDLARIFDNLPNYGTPDQSFFTLTDTTTVPPTELYSLGQSLGQSLDTESIHHNDFDSNPLVIELQVGGRTWELKLIDDIHLPETDFAAWSILFIGLLNVSLFESFLLVMSGRNEQIRRMISQKTHHLVQLNKELMQSNTELEQFSYIASHDLQAPLRHISTFAQILADDLGPKLSGENAEALHIIGESIIRMRSMIDGLLIYASIGKGPLKKEMINLNMQIKRISQELYSVFTDLGVDFQCETLPIVYSDAKFTYLILKNLIENAVSFRRDEVKPTVNVKYISMPNEDLFLIEDNGIGCNQADFERIFKMLQKLKKNKSSNGPGMGLAICKRAVERLGGRIWVESTEGSGSRFYFAIPKAQE